MALKINPLQRQPNNLDFASPTQFRFNLLKTPNVEYFVTSVNLPGISFSGEANMNTRFKSIALMGDTLEFEDLELTFLVNEDLSNYREVHDWITGIGFPKDTEQFRTASSENSELRPNTSNLNNPNTMASDASLTLLTNKNNPALKVNFKNCYPNSLSGLTYNTQVTDTEQLTATASFKYDFYEFETL
jgi:hypothetical protein